MHFTIHIFKSSKTRKLNKIDKYIHLSDSYDMFGKLAVEELSSRNINSYYFILFYASVW